MKIFNSLDSYERTLLIYALLVSFVVIMLNVGIKGAKPDCSCKYCAEQEVENG